MIDIGVSVSGSLNFPQGQEIAGAIRRGMTKIALTVANQATQNADGRPGPNIVTGRLRSSITGQVSGDGFSAVIGSNVEYAPRIELGFKGTESVKEHYRTVGAFTRNRRGRRVKAQGPANRVHVNAFTRNANAPAYPFLRPAVEYAQRIHAIEDILQREIYKTVNS